MNAANLMLSEPEMELVNNAGIILTKNTILDKAGSLLSGFSATLGNNLSRFDLPTAVQIIPPKISRGENYLGLPYRLLDFPRYFEQENIFAVRTMFWWGNHFSILLLLSGIFRDHYAGAISQNLVHADDDLMVCINASPWHHHFSGDNFVEASKIQSPRDFFMNHPFIKIGYRLPLTAWNENIERLLYDRFRMLMKLTGINYRGDERGLSPGDPREGSGL